MDFSDSNLANIFLGVVAVLFMVGNIFMKKRKTDSTPLGRVIAILFDIKKNRNLAESFTTHSNVRRFRVGSWQKSRNKLDFIPRETWFQLEKVFNMAIESNERIDAAKKFGSSSYLAGIDLDKMKKPLAEAEQAVQMWIDENMQNPEYMPKRRGLFG